MNIVLRAHSGLRYVVLALLVLAIITAYKKWQSNDPADSKLYSFALISSHIQLVLGLLLYANDWGTKVNFSMMKDALIRFFTIEHLVGMLVAIVLITISRGAGRKGNHKKVFTYYLIALIIILAMIPWPFRQLGAGWY